MSVNDGQFSLPNNVEADLAQGFTLAKGNSDSHLRWKQDGTCFVFHEDTHEGEQKTVIDTKQLDYKNVITHFWMLDGLDSATAESYEDYLARVGDEIHYLAASAEYQMRQMLAELELVG